jgi:hypothetical protein
LVQTIQANVEAEFEKPAFRKQLLEEALSQIERESFFSLTRDHFADDFQRSPSPSRSRWW